MSAFWEKVVRPIMFRFDAERAHEFGLTALRNGFARPFYVDPNKFGPGPIERFGLNFSNPLGVAAGFDKNALVPNELAALGFGFVEIGTVTYQTQPGNAKPRLFRLPEDRGLINRLGFNNDGAETVAGRLKILKRNCVLGINIGRNKDVSNDNAVENYLACFETVHSVADYIAINVSSPNTPGLRQLQKVESLESLLSALTTCNRKLGEKPLLIKIAPDLDSAEIESIVKAALKYELSGIIATNTTISRDSLKSRSAASIRGGLSGAALRHKSTEVIEQIAEFSGKKLPIIGVGGIFTAEDAFEKIAAGASLVQAYTGFVYKGPRFAQNVNNGLAKILESKGFSSIDEVVGSGIS